jgi:hypothetical protein
MISLQGIGEDLLIFFSETEYTLNSFIENTGASAINFFIGFAALVSIAILIFSGYMFITASGDPDKIEKAQKAMTAAIVGLIIVFLARAIVFFVVDLKDLEPRSGCNPVVELYPQGTECTTDGDCLQNDKGFFKCEKGCWEYKGLGSCP